MPRPRFHNPHTPGDDDVQAALDYLIRALRVANLPSRVQAWVLCALKGVTETPGLSFDEALGLKPGPGKRSFHEGRKRALIRMVGAAIHGTKTQRAEQIAAVLRGEAEPAEVLADHAVKQLRQFARIPTSAREVLRILGPD